MIRPSPLAHMSLHQGARAYENVPDVHLTKRVRLAWAKDPCPVARPTDLRALKHLGTQPAAPSSII